MNIVLYSRAQPSFSAEDLDLLINALDETGMSYRMNKGLCRTDRGEDRPDVRCGADLPGQRRYRGRRARDGQLRR